MVRSVVGAQAAALNHIGADGEHNMVYEDVGAGGHQNMVFDNIGAIGMPAAPPASPTTTNMNHYQSSDHLAANYHHDESSVRLRHLLHTRGRILVPGGHGHPYAAPSYTLAAADHIHNLHPFAVNNLAATGIVDHFGAGADDLGTASSVFEAADDIITLAHYLAMATVQSVWRENCMEQFNRVLEALHQPHRHLYIAVDMEFAADTATNVNDRPLTSTSCYQHVCRYVNGGDIVQMGLTFAFVGDGEQAPSPPIALEINFDFNVNARKYHGNSIGFLSSQGHDLTEHSKRGVAPEFVYEGLLRHLPFGDGSVTWVTFHGDYDLAFLLRLLQGNWLPPQLATFLHQLRKKLPVFYDVRVLGQLVKDGFRGSLAALAEYLGIPRNGGEHHAGSDALLTLSCFFKIVSLSGHQMHRMDARQGLLAGLEEWNMAIKCARHIDDHTGAIYVIKMLPHKFDEEATRIEELVASNFNIIGVEVIHPRLGMRSYAVDAQQNYELMNTFLKGDADSYEIIITFVNAEGMLAYSRAWKFCISSRADNGYMHPQQFAKFMASCGVMRDPNISWVTFHGAHGIARMIRSFLSPQDLPSQWCSYIVHRRAFFPAIYDVALLVRRCSDIGTLPTTECKGGLFDVARELNLKAGEADKEASRVILTLRCYMRLAERPDFPGMAMAVQGLLKESCCWKCPANC